MMVVPEKENWRHVFDLTKFNQRPEKLDPATYRDRVRKSLLTKVRIHHDLTRDEMAMTPPPEVQAMIGIRGSWNWLIAKAGRTRHKSCAS